MRNCSACVLIIVWSHWGEFSLNVFGDNNYNEQGLAKKNNRVFRTNKETATTRQKKQASQRVGVAGHKLVLHRG